MTDSINTIQASIDGACRKLEETVRDFGISLTKDVSDAERLEEVLLLVQEMEDEAALSGACFMVGAYLGEIIRKKLGGQWVTSADGVTAVQLTNGEKVFSIEKARKFVASPDSDSLMFYMQALLSMK